ncbi:hypothetical protein HNR19_001135 [Nocardioides thalensis]|uniref:Uncharacterized protein n=1 Tax=Nocardioides thalensis TaxID=1914755 RepID=A0A853BZW2_9ACTN|nr:hypothetical protein [Nocardioides thalensis]NYJ00437.1 hypothetical protein [Nocardioides thalensis]
MLTRRRLAAFVVLLLVGSGVLVGSAAIGVATKERNPATVQRVAQFYPVGPSAEYHGDSGSLGGPDPLVWRSPGEGDRAAVIEVSFQYRTKGEGPFVVSAGIGYEDGTENGYDAVVRPGELRLAPAPDGASATVRFFAPSVAGDRTHETHVGVNSVFPGRGTNLVATRKMLVTIELTP